MGIVNFSLSCIIIKHKLSVELLATLVDEKVAEAGGGSKEDIYVFQLYDNSFHMARTDDCIYLPHSKDSCGNYHVFGEAVLAPRDSQFEMFRASLPLLRKADGKRTVIMAPLPRYLYSRCCDDTGHVVGLDSAWLYSRYRVFFLLAVASKKITAKMFLNRITQESCWVTSLVCTTL